MIVAAVLALLLVAVLAVVVVGGGLALGSSRRGDDGSAGGGGGCAGVALLAVAGLGAFLLLLVAGGALIGGGGGRGDSSDDEPAPTRPPASTVPAPLTSVGTAAVVDRSAVRLVRSPDDQLRPPAPVVERLADGDVLHISAEGFGESARGLVMQCPEPGAPIGACVNQFPVYFDPNGYTRFQYQVRALPRSDPSVVLEVDGARVAARTVFGAAALPAVSLEVRARGDLADGESVGVKIGGLAAGERAQVVLCAPPAVSGVKSCGAPGPVAEVVADRSGVAVGRLTVQTGPVGADRRSCEEGVACGIAVRAGDTLLPGAIVPVAFAPTPGAAYDPSRLALGVAAALLLLLLAVWLVRITDWRVPSEAATPLLDAVVLD